MNIINNKVGVILVKKALIKFVLILGIVLSILYVLFSTAAPELGWPRFIGYVIIIFCVGILGNDKLKSKKEPHDKTV